MYGQARRCHRHGMSTEGLLVASVRTVFALSLRVMATVDGAAVKVEDASEVARRLLQSLPRPRLPEER